MLDDLIGSGHQTRVLGNEPVRIAAIHFHSKETAP